MMLKRLTIGLAFALVLAACGGDGDATPATVAAGAATTEAAMSDEEMSDESMTDEAMSDEEMSDESMSDEAMSDESMSDDGHTPTTFTVTITNDTKTAALATPIAPGAFAVHSTMDTLFVEGAVDRGEGLEALAEDGDPSGLVASLEAVPTVSATAAFANPDAGQDKGVALPGQSYTFSFEAIPGDYLSFATMFVQSNDWFYAPTSSGLNLFDGETPLEGDISDMVLLWDAGTEVDEIPGEGPNQAPRQAGPNTGDTQGAPIAEVPDYAGGLTVTITVDQ